MENKRVLMAMSGGIDSSIAALLLLEQGYELVGVTMKTWDYSTSGGGSKETGCCSLDSINDARHLAVSKNFPHYVIDIRDEFEDKIVSNFVSEYIIGNTPNPCILCNTYIKWEALLKRADDMDCQYIATGHYAQLKELNDRYYVTKGIDGGKDQSYVLWGVSQENLKRTLFPLGDYHKSEIRDLARKHGFDNLADKRESYEICFIPDNDYRGFLKRQVKGLEEKVQGGDFVLEDGTVVGKHKGFPFYTIGQRRGLEIAFGEPYYVSAIDAENNRIVIGPRQGLNSTKMIVGKINWQKYDHIEDGMEVSVQIRHHDPGAAAKLYNDGNEIRVEFMEEVSAVTPGQSAVFFEGDDVIAGGFIIKKL
ncbi:MAG: tRNA 2-thiouridine(34) synthase MnmA [Bacteroidetes bacterium]|nr:MAG: tRNA 2-thiouridine(34) synthase MnmA [Bacteroidota bacterium]